MENRTNHQFRLATRPNGLPQASNWNSTAEVVPSPAGGEILVQVLFISLDPAMRGWMDTRKSYLPPVDIGAVMRAGAVGRVLESKNGAFREGDYVSGMFGVQEYAVSDGRGVVRIDTTVAPPQAYLNALGMPGMTAYFGLLKVAELKPTDTVVVSSAAGAVGSLVGQIAKLKGCRAVGIAGGSTKCEYVKRVGFDAAIDYKSDNLVEALKSTCPNGIDVYFDNVGGETLDAVLANLARNARIALCGGISQYNDMRGGSGIKNHLSLLVNRGTMKGFIVFDFAEHYATAAREMAGWMASGRLVAREDIVTGLATFPEAFLKLFKGENQGKLLLALPGAASPRPS